MTIPTWAGPAISPLWGIGDQLSLDIASGADWDVPFKVFAADGVTPLDVADPVLEMRRDRSASAQLMAHFDTTGTSTGLITVVGTGSWVLSMTAEATSAMPTGRGFWDCFGQVGGQLTAIASGIVVVRPKVTASTGSGAPALPPTPQPGPPPVTVAAAPTAVNISFPRGDDYHLDLTLAEDGAPMDLTGAVVTAWCQTSTGQRLADFEVTLDTNIARLHLDDTATAALPPSCHWECRLTRGGDEVSTIAAGTVTVT